MDPEHKGEVLRSIVETCTDDASVNISQLQLFMINRHLLGGGGIGLNRSEDSGEF